MVADRLEERRLRNTRQRGRACGWAWKVPRGSLGSGHKPVSYFVTGKSPGDFGYEGTHEATVGQK